MENNDLESILPHKFDGGVIVITGYRGIGKSYLAAGMENPNLVTFVDFETKAKGIDSQVKFANYIPIVEQTSGTGIKGLWERCDKIVNTPADGKTLLVFDNASMLELAVTYEARRNLGKYIQDFGLNASNVENNRFGGIKSVVNYLVQEKIVAPAFNSGYRTIIVTFHIKPRWSTTGFIPGKYTIKGADRWQELSILTLILHSGESSTPAALVQKEQLGSIKFENRKFSVRRNLPLRIPECTSESIYSYLDNPADLKNPKSGETPTMAQIDPFREELSPEQLMYMVAMANAARAVEEDEKADMQVIESELKIELKLKIKELLNSGKTIPVIASELGITIPEVAKLMK